MTRNGIKDHLSMDRHTLNLGKKSGQVTQDFFQSVLENHHGWTMKRISWKSTALLNCLLGEKQHF